MGIQGSQDLWHNAFICHYDFFILTFDVERVLLTMILYDTKILFMSHNRCFYCEKLSGKCLAGQCRCQQEQAEAILQSPRASCVTQQW